MKKSGLLSLLVVCMLLIMQTISFAGTVEDAKAAYESGNKAYQQKDFKAATTAYEKALGLGLTSPEIEFNLGNACYKSGQNAAAILHYERALKLKPSDEEIQYNIRIASLKNTDRIYAIPVIFYKRWFNAVLSWFNERSWSYLFLLLAYIFFFLTVIYLTGRSLRIRRLSFTAGIPVFLFVLLTAWVASEKKSLEYESSEAIIMNTSVYVKSSPDEKGNDLFILHDGTKVNVLDELGPWKKIKIANGNTGWLPVSSITII